MQAMILIELVLDSAEILAKRLLYGVEGGAEGLSSATSTGRGLGATW